jgi:copper chaperone
MFAFKVNDMTCGHCSGTINKALKAADKDAKVTIDLGRHLVMVESVHAKHEELRAAITEAGYTPVPVEDAIAHTSIQAGSCCGHCH